jgi:hypothetical protein
MNLDLKNEKFKILHQKNDKAKSMTKLFKHINNKQISGNNIIKVSFD